MSNELIITYGLWALVVIALIVAAVVFAKWMINYKVLERVVARVTGNVEDYNLSIKQALADKSKDIYSSKEVKFTPLEMVYKLIDESGISLKLSTYGISETTLLILVGAILLVILTISSILIEPLFGVVVIAAIVVISYLLLTLVIDMRKDKLESQLNVFINACQCSASTHPDIIGIFEDVYPQLDNPLRDMIRDCVVTAHASHNRSAALRELKKASSSDQFYSIINNMEICSNMTNDYKTVIDDLRETVRIYHKSLEKKRAIVRNARVNGIVMFVLSVVILGACTQFFDGFLQVIFTHTVGLALVVAGIIIMFIQLTYRAK